MCIGGGGSVFKAMWFLSLQIAEALFQHVFCWYGLLEGILLDWGPQFILPVWRAIFKKLGISISLTLGYHPESNGQAERTVQYLGTFLQAYCHHQQHDWAEFLASPLGVGAGEGGTVTRRLALRLALSSLGHRNSSPGFHSMKVSIITYTCRSCFLSP